MSAPAPTGGITPPVNSTTPPVAVVPPVAATPPVVSPPPAIVPPPVIAPPPVELPPPPPAPVISPPPAIPPAVVPPPPDPTPPAATPPVPVTPDVPPPTAVAPPPPTPTNSPPAPTPPTDSPPAPPPPTGTNPSPPGLSPPSAVRGPPPAVLSPPSTPSAGGTPPSSSGSSSLSTGAVVGIAAGGGILALFFLFALIAFCRKRKYKKDSLPYTAAGGGGGGGAATAAAYEVGGMDDPKGYAAGGYAAGGNGRLPPGSHAGSVPLPPDGTSSVGNSRSWFTYDELHAATNGFAIENILGEGGFGRVYKGELPNGKVVAVKQLTLGGGQGDKEFRAEVEIISRVHHRHLVSLVGYCIADKQRLLVYDFVPNGTLDVNLYGNGRPIMNWEMRMRVAVGAARGLAYLHEDCHPRIIHRDIKSSNILLDDKYEAQVADFGLAKLASDTHTHVSTRVMGTFGYLAPEYAQSGKLTEKSDVYSFGVVLLELITGRKPIDTRNPAGQESLVEWTRPLLGEALAGNMEELVDPRLDGRYNYKEMFRMIEVAASCVRHTASKRPKMGQVVRVLESEEENAGLYHDLRPGHSSEHEPSFDRYGGGSDYDTQEYNSDVLRRKRRDTNKSHGSEYTSEYSSSLYPTGTVDSSNEFESGNSRPGDTRSNIVEQPPRRPPVSVRTGRASLATIPVPPNVTHTSLSGLPPTRAAPPRPGQLGNSSVASSDTSGSVSSSTFAPPPPPPNFSDEYDPIDINPKGIRKSYDDLRDGR